MEKGFWFRLFRFLLNIVIGLWILVGAKVNKNVLLEYLSYIVGGSLFVETLVSISHDIINKKYNNDENHMASHIITLIISIMILLIRPIYRDPRLEITCILWGICAIMSSSLNLNFTIYEIAHKEFKTLEFIEMLEALLEIGLSILLIMEPANHVDVHIYLLGIEYILEALLTAFHFIKKDILHIHTKRFLKEKNND